MQDECLGAVQGWMEDPVSSSNTTACLMAGLIYAAEGNHVEALKACHGANSSLEMQALSVQTYLAMDRADQAEKTVKVLPLLSQRTLQTRACLSPENACRSHSP